MDNIIKRLSPPSAKNGRIDIVLDSDAFNEIDDQFAIAYMLRRQDRFNVKGICAAPFYAPQLGNMRSSSPEDGMRKSYDEIIKILKLAGEQELCQSVYCGSGAFLSDEKTAVESDAAAFLVSLASAYTPEAPLYIVAIGAITNVASAILKDPSIVERVVIVWLGGNALHMPDTREFNMIQDVAAARVVFDSRAPLVQLPCFGVVDRFSTSRWELEHWLISGDPLCRYLLENTVEEAERYGNKDRAWTRIIWDVTAIGYLLNDSDRFMTSELIHSPIVQYDGHYSSDSRRHMIRYVNYIKRDALYTDLFKTLRG